MTSYNHVRLTALYIHQVQVIGILRWLTPHAYDGTCHATAP